IMKIYLFFFTRQSTLLAKSIFKFTEGFQLSQSSSLNARSLFFNIVIDFPLFLSFFLSHLVVRFTFNIFKISSVRNKDSFIVTVKLNHLKSQYFIYLSIGSIFLFQMTNRSKRFKSVWKLYDSTFFIFTQD